MIKKTLLFCIGAFIAIAIKAQDNSIAATTPTEEIKEDLPVISYSLKNNKLFTIAEIKVTGIENSGYDDFTLISFSGLSVGQKVTVPGDELSLAVSKFWKHGLFSDVSMRATKQTEDSVWLEIRLKLNPLISTINYYGIKKGEREDIETKIGALKGTQLTQNIINRIRKRIKDYFSEKGFNNAEVKISQSDDIANEGKVILEITVDKNEKTKINEIIFTGNESLTEFELKRAMKKTNEGFSLKKRPKLSILKLFSTKKFVREEYQNDLDNIIKKYNEKGYRDAVILMDSVVQINEKRVSVYINIAEGNKYHIRSINWIGNTLYPSSSLDYMLDMKTGDVYNLSKLEKRLHVDDDAVGNVYQNNGYIFSQMDAVELSIENDSIDLEIRVFEGTQASIKRVSISGNDRVYEDIIRRELLTKPGQLYSREAIMNTYREIAQMGHFDPENMDVKPIPDEESGTVDIA